MTIQERIAIVLFVVATVSFFVWVVRLWVKK